MKAELKCPSCECTKVRKTRTIPAREIIDYYSDNGIDVAYLFKGIEELTQYECEDCSLGFFWPIVLGDDHYYHCMQQGDWYYLDEKPEYDYVAQFIGPKDKVLDVGSGRGAFSHKLHCQLYQGIEFSESAVALAAKDGVNVIAESVEQHALRRKEFYDVVVTFQVLEHVAEADSFLKGVVDCLRPGGKLAIAVPNCRSFVEWRKNLLNIPPHHQLHWNEQALRKLADIHHLKVWRVCKERVSEVHRESFYSTLLQCLKDKISPSNTTVNRNFAHTAKTEPPKDLSHSLANAVKCLFRLVRLHRFFVGHTITVIYEKK